MVTILLAARASSSRSWLTNNIVFGRLRRASLPATPSPGTSRKLSGSSRRSTSASPRNSTSSASRFCSPPESVEHSRSATVVERAAERGGRADVPEHLGVVPAGVAPRRVGPCEPHAGAFAGIAWRATRRRRRARPPRAAPPAAQSDTSNSRTVRHRSVDPISWRMKRSSPVDRGPHRGAAQLAREDAQERGLAAAVGADQRDVLTVADAERDAVEQHTPTRPARTRGR